MEAIRSELVYMKKRKTEDMLEFYKGIPFWRGVSGLQPGKGKFLSRATGNGPGSPEPVIKKEMLIPKVVWAIVT